MKRQAALTAASQRQVVAGERVAFATHVGKQHITVTDRRLIILKIGPLTGETAESVPLGAITGVTTTVSEGRMVAMQLAVPGRSWGEIAISGEDLSPVHAALVRCLPAVGGAG